MKSSLLAPTLLLAACASHQVSDLYEFAVVDSETDSKLFEYSFVLDPNQRQPGTGKKLLPGNFAVSFDDMREALEKYMRAFPYCSQGYFVYDESFDGQQYRLRGECQESK